MGEKSRIWGFLRRLQSSFGILERNCRLCSVVAAGPKRKKERKRKEKAVGAFFSEVSESRPVL